MAAASPSVARLAAVAGLLHAAFDFATSRLEATSPPYLLFRHMPDVLREMLGMLGPGAVSGVTAFMTGILWAIFAVALQDVAARRFRKLAAVYAALWVVVGGLMFLVYLDAPLPVVAGSLAAGLPRALVVAWVLDRMVPRPTASTA
jgi:RsiW-degrading membrane proteinase PrsW (M82 family)